ncbi:MAG TPA: hypothetical protein DCO75_12655 [Fibrobacteres bacterium]|jgi:hypothetical protein|nr:hypothetical protein [Fibrobacterota bacterium]
MPSFLNKMIAGFIGVLLFGIPIFSQSLNSTSGNDENNNATSISSENKPANSNFRQNTKSDSLNKKDMNTVETIGTENKSNNTVTKEDYLQGRINGKADATGHPAWILAGLAGTGFCLLIGCAGIGVAALVPPSPPEQSLIGKSQNYILGYTESYKSKSRWKNVLYASGGCAMAAFINIIINLASGNTAF